MQGLGRWWGCLALIVALGAACSPPASPDPVPSAVVDRTSWTCPDPSDIALPIWAREGFTPPTDPVPHLTGTHGSIVAVPFGWPLREHQPPGHQNKILWIPKSGGGPLHIVATEQATGATASQDLPDGPGPSIIDMPAAGCWRFDLTWSDQHDEMFVHYFG